MISIKADITKDNEKHIVDLDINIDHIVDLVVMDNMVYISTSGGGWVTKYHTKEEVIKKIKEARKARMVHYQTLEISLDEEVK